MSRVTRIVHTSPDGGEGLLAVVLRSLAYHEDPQGFVTPPEASLQLAEFKRKKGDKVPLHVHRPVKRETRGTQEVLICLSGVMTVRVFTSSGEFVDCVSLWPGDSICLLSGGHSVEFTLDTTFMEVKQGPYAGAEDKTYL
jgi:hypothetical protein